MLVLGGSRLLAEQVPLWLGVMHHRFVATIEGGVSVTKAQHPSIAEVGPTTSTPFSKSSYPNLPSPKDRVQTLAGSITLSSTKALSIVGKTEGSYCPSEDNKS